MEKPNVSTVNPTSEPSNNKLQALPSKRSISSSANARPPTVPLLAKEAYIGLVEAPGGAVFVAVGESVEVGANVEVGVAVDVLVGVSVAVDVFEAVGVIVAVLVTVDVEVFVGDVPTVGVLVAVDVLVAVGVEVKVAVGVDVWDWFPARLSTSCGALVPSLEE